MHNIKVVFVQGYVMIAMWNIMTHIAIFISVQNDWEYQFPYIKKYVFVSVDGSQTPFELTFSKMTKND